MDFLKMSLAKARMYEADSEAGGTPAATLAPDSGGEGGAADTGEGNQGGEELKAPNWITSVPEEHRDNKALWKHSEYKDFLKHALDNEAKLADFDEGKVLTIPAEDAGDDVREAFYRQLGKPESADGYELEDPGFPDGLERDTELEGHLKQWAFNANIPADQLKSLVGSYNAYVADVYSKAKDAYERDLQEKTEALKAEMKDGYNEFVVKAKRAASKIGGDEFLTLLQDSGLETHPTFIKVFGKIGAAMSDDSALGGLGGDSGGEPKHPTGVDGKRRFSYESDKQKE